MWIHHERVEVLTSLSCRLVQALILAADRVDGQAGTTPKKVGKSRSWYISVKFKLEAGR